MSPLRATVTFLEGTLRLTHIPLELYPLFLQPILKVLLPPSQGASSSSPSSQPAVVGLEDGGDNQDGYHQHGGFLNISVTPVECSIVCDADWAESVVRPAIRRLPEDAARKVAVSADTYAVLHIITGGSDAGSRVAELTSPMAFANIPIFFITTYYCDFILFPTKDRQAVVDALLAKGFGWADEGDQARLVSPAPPSRSAPLGPPRVTTTTFVGSNSGSISSGYALGYGPWVAQQSALSEPLVDVNTPPSPTPSFRAQDGLQARTFALLKKRRVIPHVERNLVLVQCTGLRPDQLTTTRTADTHRHHHHQHHQRSSSSFPASPFNNWAAATTMTPSMAARSAPTTCWVDTIDTKLYTSIVTALASQPRFLSLTLAQDDPPSVLLDRDLLGLFGDSLIGPMCITTPSAAGPRRDDQGSGGEGEKDAGCLVPVFLDLADLPFEATGIVSGVAGGLVREMGGVEGTFGGLSYLSTARAGVVIFESEGAVNGLKALWGLLMDDEVIEDDSEEEGAQESTRSAEPLPSLEQLSLAERTQQTSEQP